jgi:hypothetical protein
MRLSKDELDWFRKAKEHRLLKQARADKREKNKEKAYKLLKKKGLPLSSLWCRECGSIRVKREGDSALNWKKCQDCGYSQNYRGMVVGRF